jgi:hypothetical protein
MKKIFGMGLLLMLFASVGWGQKAELYKVVPISPDLSVMATHTSWLDMVLPLNIFVGDADGNPYFFLDYQAGQVWYLYFTFVNGATVAKSFKAEFNIYYGDGASYANKRYSLSVPAASAVFYKINVSAYIAKLGLITFVGRVYGTGMGNCSDVKSQVMAF